jgi:hypothetical protein
MASAAAPSTKQGISRSSTCHRKSDGDAPKVVAKGTSDTAIGDLKGQIWEKPILTAIPIPHEALSGIEIASKAPPQSRHASLSAKSFFMIAKE